MTRCDIVIPVWDQLEVTRECVESIRKHTAQPYRLIVVDNGSSVDTKIYLEALKDLFKTDMLLLRNERNLGFVKAVNQALRSSDAPYVCLLNNDTVVTDGWLSEMIKVFESNPGLGILNPSSNTLGQFPSQGMTIDSYAAGIRVYSLQTQELYTCRGFCMLIKREVIDKVGLLDEAYGIGYFEETDYCKRAQGAGFKMARAKASYVYHKESATFKTVESKGELFAKNEKIFLKRWGRPLRVGYLVGTRAPDGKVEDAAMAIARSGHQVFIFLKNGLEWPVKSDHFEIRRLDASRNFFVISSICKVLKRRRKKRIDVLVTESAPLGSFLRMIKFLHGSDVMVSPDKTSLMAVLEDRSRRI